MPYCKRRQQKPDPGSRSRKQQRLLGHPNSRFVLLGPPAASAAQLSALKRQPLLRDAGRRSDPRDGQFDLRQEKLAHSRDHGWGPDRPVLVWANTAAAVSLG
jgi:hypothetical protein